MAGLDAALQLDCLFIHTSGNFSIPTAGNVGGTYSAELHANPKKIGSGQHKVIRGIKDINKCGRGQWTIDEYESSLRELLRPGTYYNPQSPYNLLFTQH